MDMQTLFEVSEPRRDLYLSATCGLFDGHETEFDWKGAS